jgi:hypothetical protein
MKKAYTENEVLAMWRIGELTLVGSEKHRLATTIVDMAHRWFLEEHRSKASDTKQYKALIAALTEWRGPGDTVPERHRCCVREE